MALLDQTMEETDKSLPSRVIDGALAIVGVKAVTEVEALDLRYGGLTLGIAMLGVGSTVGRRNQANGIPPKLRFFL